MKKTATIGLKKPCDLHTDDNAGTCLKKHSYRFYEMLMNEDESVCVTKEVHVNQNSNSEVIADVINRRSRSGWKKVHADISRVFAVISWTSLTKRPLVNMVMDLKVVPHSSCTSMRSIA